MKNYITKDEWNIIEDGFHPSFNKISESLFSIGNGHIGQRANFEEEYSGETHSGSYVGGVYYPDKTRVGWWKNGYPEYFAKVINSANWIGIKVRIDGEILDLNKCQISSFKRILDMKKGLLKRSVQFTNSSNKTFKIDSERFCSMAQKELGYINYTITSLSQACTVELLPYLDFDVINEDSNYDEKFWNEISRKIDKDAIVLTAATKKTDFHVSAGISYDVFIDEQKQVSQAAINEHDKFAGYQCQFELVANSSVRIIKYASILSSLDHSKNEIQDNCYQSVTDSKANGYQKAKEEHIETWAKKWEECDVTIEGDLAAQQGIRFNIFQLNQTYTGQDPRLNIGPKGFTGEKYGGSTYWDTEAYCLPFYQSTANKDVAWNLLYYRYKHLQKAIENAEKLGFSRGAALYPMVTMNGEECHNEWEITFEEIHRNGAIAYAIFDYTRYTANKEYLHQYGLEVLIAISRFWAQRVNYSNDKKKYVLLNVTGPNEYENNVNNNWYTNYLAQWCLDYTKQEILAFSKVNEAGFKNLIKKTEFNFDAELNHWADISTNIYFPYDSSREIFLQQDGFLDKELIPAASLPEEQRPICQNWSWDRILRSPYIKQADVLQGLYFFEEEFSKETIAKNFDFYEALTVHESSLSPCVHSILASSLKKYDKAYEMYLRTARLDLDDYNNDTEDGCHITSMAGSWMSIVKGFAGMRIKDNLLSFEPHIPKQWKSFAFKIRFRDRLLNIVINDQSLHVDLIYGAPLDLKIYDINTSLETSVTINLQFELENKNGL
jgi:maltose phosphorylase